MVDAAAGVDAIDRIAHDERVTIPLAIDLDMSSAYPGLYFGMYRSPVRDAAGALALANRIAERQHVRLDGLMGYEGQIAGVADTGLAAAPQRAGASPEAPLGARDQRAPPGVHSARGRRPRAALRERRRHRQHREHARRCVGHRAGGRLRPLRAGAVRSLRGVSCAAGRQFRAAGRADSAAGHRDLFGRRLYRIGAGRQEPPAEAVAAGRLHADRQRRRGRGATPVRVPRGVAPAIGDPILFRHAKAGELCERFNTLLLIRGGRVVGEAPTYRGEGKSFF